MRDDDGKASNRRLVSVDDVTLPVSIFQHRGWCRPLSSQSDSTIFNGLSLHGHKLASPDPNSHRKRAAHTHVAAGSLSASASASAVTGSPQSSQAYSSTSSASSPFLDSTHLPSLSGSPLSVTGTQLPSVATSPSASTTTIPLEVLSASVSSFVTVSISQSASVSPVLTSQDCVMSFSWSEWSDCLGIDVCSTTGFSTRSVLALFLRSF
jgi:hypothetical protein